MLGNTVTRLKYSMLPRLLHLGFAGPLIEIIELSVVVIGQ